MDSLNFSGNSRVGFSLSCSNVLVTWTLLDILLHFVLQAPAESLARLTCSGFSWIFVAEMRRATITMKRYLQERGKPCFSDFYQWPTFVAIAFKVNSIVWWCIAIRNQARQWNLMVVLSRTPEGGLTAMCNGIWIRRIGKCWNYHHKFEKVTDICKSLVITNYITKWSDRYFLGPVITVGEKIVSVSPEFLLWISRSQSSIWTSLFWRHSGGVRFATNTLNHQKRDSVAWWPLRCATKDGMRCWELCWDGGAEILSFLDSTGTRVVPFLLCSASTVTRPWPTMMNDGEGKNKTWREGTTLDPQKV